ncbi:MAG: argininosuccinate lyase [Candidatus Magasanikbacteria bacterium]|nr:argininosuccinate lyase [Candidatus Magasanikbacteria bacterium]
MSKLWQKKNSVINKLVESYTVAEDYKLDKEICLYDMEASWAHAQGLHKIGLLTSKELATLKKGLAALKADWLAGKIEITVADEDCHTMIENYLVKKIGAVGKKIHSGRSRNDQVLVALRLYLKDSLFKVRGLSLQVAESLLKKANQYKNVPISGYSHYQIAMISSVSHYMGAYLESVLDDIDFLDKVISSLDKNPLGSAAGFGVNVALDRAFTADKLNFSAIQVNSLYCQNSKGKMESMYLEALSQLMLTAGRVANDFIIFTMKELNFFQVDESLTTGSSIMPQKKNLDTMEILRANVKVVISNGLLIKNLAVGVLSGYNRDTQLLKKPIFESTKITLDSLQILDLLINNFVPNEEEIKSKIGVEILAADVALNLVKTKGLAFRDAYREAMANLPKDKVDYVKEIKKKISLGSAGNLGLEIYNKRIKQLKVRA